MTSALMSRPQVTTSAASDSDDSLLARMRADDTAAYRLLVERHIDRAFGLALRVLKNSADAEDVTQEAFVKAWQKRHDWQEGRAKFSTWLYRVIVNACIDQLRGPRGENLDDVPEPRDESEDAVSCIHRQQVVLQLDKALSRLPAPQRAAITLSYHEGLSNKEIAEVMGTSLFAVESLLKRGRQRLRELLKRAEGDVRSMLSGD
ncbi:RNA polymerase sigma factor [Radicibacter daui]|uniref:RNA polymerase sigma factor n=1 Tax=Radicibacter daui TaxID=3064829 RepID=UPI004046F9D1